MGAAPSWEYSGVRSAQRISQAQAREQSQHRSKEMTNLINVSRLAKLTAVLAASAALMSSAANAKGDHHQSNNMQNTGPRPHFVISGQPANVKRVTRATKKKEMAEKKKGCGKIIVPTAECGVSSKNPVGSTVPKLPSQADGSKPAP